jgi:hypothetical protein
MPIVPFHQEEEVRRAVRRGMIQDPMITVNRMQVYLMKKGFTTGKGGCLDWEYVRKLMRKVKKAAEVGTDREQEIERITKVRERYNLIADRLFKIAFWDLDSLRELIPMPTVTEQINALKAITELDLKVYDAEKIAGLFQQQGARIINAQWRSRPMPDEFYSNVVKAFESHGFGPDRMKEIQARAVEARVVAEQNGNDTAPTPTPINSTELELVAG